ncbi:MAG: DUF1127 domain-containing protein [Rhodospirillaceae bacterium]|nr:DUF1127 domain-containing protein [Rhodospirillaceae bacterium]
MVHWIGTIYSPNVDGAGKMHRRYSRVLLGYGLFARQFTAILEAIPEWRQRGEERRQLLELDERLLKDIGVSRAEAMEEARKPFWVV